jgi:5S rRNA maturation endonuclease (ribonuclease M5)
MTGVRTNDILGKLDGVKRAAPHSWRARCPAHRDATPSLSITESVDGRTLVNCHAGCTPDSVMSALGLKLSDLFAGKPVRVTVAPQPEPKVVATYDYHDADGQLVFQAVRQKPKSFRQRRPDPQNPGEWIWNMHGVQRVLFRLPQLLEEIKAGSPTIICEGEKDVLALVERHFSATCNAGGAGKWEEAYTQSLAGDTDIIIIADKDEPGRKHAQLVASALHGKVARIRIVELPDVNGKPVKDAADFFAAGGDAMAFTKFINAQPVYEPTTCSAADLSMDDSHEDITALIRGKILEAMLDTDTPTTVRYSALAAEVVDALKRIGRFYFHAESRDFDSAMFFNAHRKRLERIRSNAFSAWLSDWLVVNRASGLFKFISAAVDTAALSEQHATAIMPESFWAARPGAVYLSNGDGAVAKITGKEVAMVDNGTDGVLFSAGRTLAPWNLTSPRDPFETCALFRNFHCGATHGRLLAQLWMYSLATAPRSKPPLGLIGDIGSGKTRSLKGMAEFYGLPFRAAKVEDQLEANFWPNLHEGGLFILDNADTKCRWLADAVASAATDGCSQRRKLYTNSETVMLRANSWLAITSANPTFGNDAGLADRLLVVRMEPKSEATSDVALRDEILRWRDAGLSHVADVLHRALADTAATPSGLNARHPDFAAFAVKIGRALGREAEAIAALRTAESDKSAFCLENDPIGAALLTVLRQRGSFSGKAAELMPLLVEADGEMGEWLTAKKLSKRLAALWPHLQRMLKKAERQEDRKGFATFKFEQIESADCADFQEAILEKV